jgi:hypothetical protein
VSKVINFMDLFPNAPLALKMQEVRINSGKTIAEIYGDSFTRQRVRQSETMAVNATWRLVCALSQGTGWHALSWLRLFLHQSLPRMSGARLQETIERYISLSQDSADVVLDSLDKAEFHSAGDLKRALGGQCSTTPALRNEPMAVWFLTLAVLG